MASARWCSAVVARRRSAGANADDRVVLYAVFFHSIGVVERPAAVLQVDLLVWDVVNVC